VPWIPDPQFVRVAGTAWASGSTGGAAHRRPLAPPSVRGDGRSPTVRPARLFGSATLW
jgi:hypothetical protein